MLMVAIDECREDEEVMVDMVKVKRLVSEGKGKKTKSRWRQRRPSEQCSTLATHATLSLSHREASRI